jgi:predicted nucleic acid-binding protein
MLVYLDTCCYGRVRDNQSRSDIRAETVAIKAIIKRATVGKLRIIGSFAVTTELKEIKDDFKRDVITAFYLRNVNSEVSFIAEDAERARELTAQGVGNMDATHLAAAEAAGVDFLLTVDADFIRKCNLNKLTAVNVMNPLDFLNGGY